MISTSNNDYLPYDGFTKSEEEAYFIEVCGRIIENPRFYLDNLERLFVFRMSVKERFYGHGGRKTGQKQKPI
jgi:hypothetical protein